MKNSIEKYLKNYAEPEVAQLVTFPNSYVFDHSLVIPVYKESADFIKALASGLLINHKVLVVLVINQPETDENLEPQQTLFNQVIALSSSVKQLSQSLTLVSLINSQSAVLLVNRFEQPIPVKQGVGLARKIGADVALYLINNKNIRSRIIASTDADASLPDDYFCQQTQLVSDVSVAYFNFCHHSEDAQVNQATQTYERSLRYYVDGLKHAGSKYAFFTIGSTLIFNAEAYAQVRGFPKKSAGEDFYLINKLAKVGKTKFIDSSKITLKARISDRVPFGTGPAVKKILELQNSNQIFSYYAFEVFEALKVVNDNDFKLANNPNEYLAWLDSLPKHCNEALLAIGFEKFINPQLNQKPKQFIKLWLDWFDAFRTLKFIHFLRDNYYPNKPFDS